MIVIPEIDMPGHFSSAIAAYPEISCLERNIKVSESFGIKFDIACCAKRSTTQFIHDILDELCTLFPDMYFHIGGDEVPSLRWQNCPDCQAKKESLGLKTWAEYQAVFMNEIADYLKLKGKIPIMWNESEPTGLINSNVVWQFWNGKSKNMAQETNLGRKIINSQSVPFYLDLPHSINSIKKIIDTPIVGNEVIKNNVIGVEFPLWSELIPNQKQAEKMTFPRLIVCAQKAWNTKSISYEQFQNDYSSYKRVLRKLNIAPMKDRRAFPKGIYWLCDRVWWERRQLYWSGLYNLIDNIKATNMAKKKAR